MNECPEKRKIEKHVKNRCSSTKNSRQSSEGKVMTGGGGGMHIF
jgi:hypothetical protein